MTVSSGRSRVQRGHFPWVLRVHHLSLVVLRTGTVLHAMLALLVKRSSAVRHLRHWFAALGYGWTVGSADLGALTIGHTRCLLLRWEAVLQPEGLHSGVWWGGGGCSWQRSPLFKYSSKC